jgi:hypothetical protein
VRLELAKGALVETWGMIRADFWGIYRTILAIEALSIGAGIAGIAAGIVAGYAIAQASVIAGIAVGAVLAAAGVYLATAVRSLNYSFIDAKCRKARIGFRAAFRENLRPMLWYDIALALVYGIVFAPFIAAIALSVAASAAGAAPAGLLIQFMLRIGLAAVSAAVWFFIQFAIFELLLGRAGLAGGFGRSLRIVRGNLLETAAFSIVLWAVESAISIPAIILMAALFIAGLFAYGGAGAAAGTAILAIALAFAVALAVALQALFLMLNVVAGYKFWQRARTSK